MSSALVLAAYVTSVDGAIATQAARDGDWPASLRAIVNGAPPRIERIERPSAPAVEARISVPPESRATDQLVATTRAALALFDDWLGPYPHSTLAVVGVPWNSEWAGASYAGVVATRSRLLAPTRDVSAERLLIAGIARQYWIPAGGKRVEPSFQEGLVIYTATRGLHELLGGRNLLTVRAFGDFVSHPVRAIQLSPNMAQALPRVRELDEVTRPHEAPWRMATAARGGAARRTALMLHTLERYIGWPALQPALATLRASDRGLTPGDLAAVLSEQRSVDLSWFVTAALADDSRFDYAVERVSGDPLPDGTHRTVVALRRHGNGVFAGTSRPRGDQLGASPALPVEIKFDDETAITDYWDGRDETLELQYISRAPVASAAVDPSLMLLLDENRSNNSRRTHVPVEPIGVRLALHWSIWLQDMMLSCVSLM
jgi:hypothetical protein